MAQTAQWKKLAVRMREVDPRTLTANPKNWRIHGAAQREALRGSIHELGYGDPVELMDGTDLILDGHLRVDLAIQEGQETITVVDMALYTESDADQYLLTKDPIAAMATSDKERLDALMRENATSEAGLQAMIAEMAVREGIVPTDDAAWGDAFGALPDGDKSPFEQMTFTVSTAQAATVRDAMTRAKHGAAFVDTGNENSNGNALAAICEAYVDA